MNKGAWLLVDGYNVLHNWPAFDKLRVADLSHARDRLADTIADYASFKGCLPAVVFDAYAAKGDAVVEHRPGVDVVFTAEGETADSYIEKAAYRLLREKNDVFVVTGDQSEQMAVLGMGAYRLAVGEFIGDCLKTGRAIAEAGGGGLLAGRREVSERLASEVVTRLEKLRRDD
ncbi:MAG: NYN domain-containing protein [Acidaminococcales bacterium]|jgi:predicted RNA-binding protein with PIN domain|nr:NYN domain-containing protein [Acidaminococcales bacterium]